MNKFLVIKEFLERNWQVNDICLLDEKSATQMIEKGYVEPYLGDEPHKHVAITVAPIKLSVNSRT